MWFLTKRMQIMRKWNKATYELYLVKPLFVNIWPNKITFNSGFRITIQLHFPIMDGEAAFSRKALFGASILESINLTLIQEALCVVYNLWISIISVQALLTLNYSHWVSN